MASQAFNDLKAAVDAVVVYAGKLKSEKVDAEAQRDAANAELVSRDEELVPVTKQLTDLVAG